MINTTTSNKMKTEKFNADLLIFKILGSFAIFIYVVQNLMIRDLLFLQITTIAILIWLAMFGIIMYSLYIYHNKK